MIKMNKKKLAKTKHDIVQVKNPKTERYIKIDRALGQIIGEKTTKGPYKNIPVARQSK